MPKKILLPAAVVLVVLVFWMWSGTGAVKALPKFSSQNLDGQGVTSSIFVGKKLTMVNVWATWCPPCVQEMPGLGNLARSMPGKTQLVGLLMDSGSPGAIQKAQSILATSKADFSQICISEEMVPFLKTVNVIPTTFFVDSRGRIIAAPIVGARSEQQYRAEIEKTLKKLR